ALPLGHAMMLGPTLVLLPVHARCPPVEHLHPVRPDVPHARFGVLREHEGKRDVTPPVTGPALEDRELVERRLPAHDLLTRGALDDLWHEIPEPTDHRQHLQRI